MTTSSEEKKVFPFTDSPCHVLVPHFGEDDVTGLWGSECVQKGK